MIASSTISAAMSLVHSPLEIKSFHKVIFFQSWSQDIAQRQRISSLNLTAVPPEDFVLLTRVLPFPTRDSRRDLHLWRESASAMGWTCVEMSIQRPNNDSV